MKRTTLVGWATVSALLLIATAGPAVADPKQIVSAIDEASQSCRGVSQQIWEFKEPRVALKAPVTVQPLLDSVEARLVALGVAKNQFRSSDEFGSSDLGMVSYAFPTVNLTFKIAPDGTAGHSDAFRDAANTDEGWQATVIAGKAVALSAYDMLTKPEKLKAVQESFKEAKAKEGK